MLRVPLNNVEQFLATGWTNTEALDVSRLVEAGRTVTIIVSDGPFEVPDVLPGGAQVVGSRQHTFGSQALVKVRVLTRGV